MFGRNYDQKYALKEELDEVRNCLYRLQTETVEIKTGINFAKWLLAALGVVIPVFTNVIQYVGPTRSPDTLEIRPEVIRLPDGTYYNPRTGTQIVK